MTTPANDTWRNGYRCDSQGRPLYRIRVEDEARDPNETEVAGGEPRDGDGYRQIGFTNPPADAVTIAAQQLVQDNRLTAVEGINTTQTADILLRTPKANLALNLKDYGAVSGQNIDAALVLLAAAMPATGSCEIVVPRGTYSFTTWPNWDGKRAIIVRGEAGLSGGAGGASILTYTGTGTGSAISCRSSLGIEFHSVHLTYTSASFTGIMLDLSSTGTKGSATGRGTDTQLAKLVGCRFDGVRTANLVDLDNAIICAFYDTVFAGGVIGVKGAAATATYSNAMFFHNCTFLGNVTSHTQNAKLNWSFFGCTFEPLMTVPGVLAGAGAHSYTASVTSIDLNFFGCYFSDATTVGTWITFTGTGLGVYGGAFGFGAKAIATTASSTNITIKPALIANVAVGVEIGATNRRVHIQTDFSTVATPVSYVSARPTESTLPASTGGLVFDVPKVGVRNSAVVTATTGVVRSVPFDTERWDNDAMHDNVTNNTRITIQTPGLYDIGAQIRWNGNATGSRSMEIKLNATTRIAITHTAAPGVLGCGQNLSRNWECVAGDFLEVQVFQDSGGNLDLQASSGESPEFWASKVG